MFLKRHWSTWLMYDFREGPRLVPDGKFCRLHSKSQSQERKVLGNKDFKEERTLHVSERSKKSHFYLFSIKCATAQNNILSKLFNKSTYWSGQEINNFYTKIPTLPGTGSEVNVRSPWKLEKELSLRAQLLNHCLRIDEGYKISLDRFVLFCYGCYDKVKQSS